MDARAGFAAGGFAVGAAVVAVACAVTLSNSTALVDVPGAAAGVDVVRVTPSAVGVTPTPRTTAPAVAAPEISAPAPTAEIVPAPEPRDVAEPAPVAPPAEQPSTEQPAEAAAPAAPAPPVEPDLTRREIEEQAVQSGSFDRLRAWAIANGWSSGRIDRWIDFIEAKRLEQAMSDLTTDRLKTPAHAGDESGRSSGSKRAQSPQPPRGD
ncbi:hypothetical protein ABZ477_00365 [Microbacterium sp. NPDC019599]|uniref:hypothetical protein n=1 Tax=Microbacterium sp. NPDC019599 TaxID=3154690 RepID=UPI0033E17927